MISAPSITFRTESVCKIRLRLHKRSRREGGRGHFRSGGSGGGRDTCPALSVRAPAKLELCCRSPSDTESHLWLAVARWRAPAAVASFLATQAPCCIHRREVIHRLVSPTTTRPAHTHTQFRSAHVHTVCWMYAEKASGARIVRVPPPAPQPK